MVHTRLNERETNPNPHINFITALPNPDHESQEEARQLLRALAAQVRPIMKDHGLAVNSFEEYEHNPVFAGRNWEAGETIELVLRRLNGSFLPISWLMSTLCHELAHIKHMNHGPGFQALWARLRSEVSALQARGYYGDGYWSSGQRLADSARISGDGAIAANELPEYVCGGAQTRKRPTSHRRRRRGPSEVGSSNHTGAQSARKRKAGRRVTGDQKFIGEGTALNDGLEGDEKARGTGFRKQATSKRAREERLLAIERRLKTLQSESPRSQKVKQEEDSDDSDIEIVPETDADRRARITSTTAPDELEQMKFSQAIFSQNSFVWPASQKNASSKLSLAELHDSCFKDVVDLSDDKIVTQSSIMKTSRIGSANSSNRQWSCLICTLLNEPDHLACSVCAMPRGEKTWTES